MLTDVQIDLFFSMPISLVLAYFYTRLLTIKEPVEYFACVFALAVTVNSYRAGMGPEFRLVLGFFCDGVLPVLMSSGSLGRRVLTALLVATCLFCDEVFAIAFWMFVTGSANAGYDMVRESLEAFLLMHAVHLAVLVALLSLLQALLSNAFRVTTPLRTWLYIGFPATQLALITVATFVGQYIATNPAYYGACSAILVISLLINVAYLRALEAGIDAELERERVRGLESALEQHYRFSESVLAQRREAAKRRHDIRNHLQLIEALVQQGKFKEAEGYAIELEARLACKEIGND